MSDSKLRIAFFGTPDFAATALSALCETENTTPILVVTQPDRPAGRGGHLKGSPVKDVALSYDIPLLQPESIRKDRTFLETLHTFAPIDIAVIVAFGQIIPEPILSLPKAGFVNVHASLLPRWRGAAPIQRAILASDEVSGISLMKLEAGLDTGPVYCKAELPLAITDDFGTVHDKLALLGADLLRNNLYDIARGDLLAIPQPTEGITYAKKIENHEAEIDWSKSVQDIYAQIKAFSPSPGAFSSFMGKRLKILKALPKQNTPQAAHFAPGQISFCDKKNILEIECSDGSLALQEIQLEGRKRMSVADFLRGNRVSVGTFLGTKKTAND